MLRGRMGGAGIVIFIIILLIILGGIAYFVMQGGGLDPCKREFQDCNHGCGEGWLSGACKEVCSYEYRKCKG